MRLVRSVCRSGQNTSNGSGQKCSSGVGELVKNVCKSVHHWSVVSARGKGLFECLQEGAKLVKRLQEQKELVKPDWQELMEFI